MKKNKIAVIAGNHQQFRHCCKDYQLSREEAFNVYREQDLLGIKSCDVIFYGTFYDRHNIDKLEAMINSRGFVDVTEELHDAHMRRERRKHVAAKRQGLTSGCFTPYGRQYDQP